MGFIGYRQSPLAKIFFIVFAVICAITAFLQLRYLRKLKILSVYLLPVLSFCLCFENILLFLSNSIDEDSAIADAGKVFYSMQIPLFLLIVFEVPCRLHEARSVQFFLVPFDQEKEVSKLPGELIISLMRLLAAGAFAINLLVNFGNMCSHQFDDDHKCSLPLRGGYVTLGHNSHNIALWMALSVPSYLSVVAFNMYISLHRYGKNATLSLTSTAPWTVLGVTTLCQATGQLFGVELYPVTSNAGELLLLLGVSWIVYLVQHDLSITRNFADFLHRSNVAFQNFPAPEPPERHTHVVVHHHHRGENHASGTPALPTPHPHPKSRHTHVNHLQHLTNPDECRPVAGANSQGGPGPAVEMVPVRSVVEAAATPAGNI